jgi:hypothetical protein
MNYEFEMNAHMEAVNIYHLDDDNTYLFTRGRKTSHVTKI